MDKIIEFIKTGTLSGISLGMTKESLVEMLGDADEVINISKNVTLLIYGHLELYFKANFIDRIYLKINDWDLEVPAELGDIESCVSKSDNLDQVIFTLEDEGISWVLDKKNTGNDTVCILCENEVGIFYSLTDHSIYSIGTTSFNIADYI